MAFTNAYLTFIIGYLAFTIAYFTFTNGYLASKIPHLVFTKSQSILKMHYSVKASADYLLRLLMMVMELPIRIKKIAKGIKETIGSGNNRCLEKRKGE